MTTTRAQEVAEVLWELKRAEKIAKYSTIARRAGFSAGTNGRAMLTCLKTIRRDWPHLQWWRAVKDDGTVEAGSDQEKAFREAGFELEEGKEAVAVASFDEHLMDWEAAEKAAEAEAEAEAE
jgi:alkylated DNA nucleotide flippase Atl1